MSQISNFYSKIVKNWTPEDRENQNFDITKYWQKFSQRQNQDVRNKKYHLDILSTIKIYHKNLTQRKKYGN